MCVCVCVCARERSCLCERERERKRNVFFVYQLSRSTFFSFISHVLSIFQLFCLDRQRRKIKPVSKYSLTLSLSLSLTHTHTHTHAHTHIYLPTIYCLFLLLLLQQPCKQYLLYFYCNIQQIHLVFCLLIETLLI